MPIGLIANTTTRPLFRNRTAAVHIVKRSGWECDVVSCYRPALLECCWRNRAAQWRSAEPRTALGTVAANQRTTFRAATRSAQETNGLKCRRRQWSISRLKRRRQSPHQIDCPALPIGLRRLATKLSHRGFCPLLCSRVEERFEFQARSTHGVDHPRCPIEILLLARNILVGRGGDAAMSRRLAILSASFTSRAFEFAKVYFM